MTVNNLYGGQGIQLLGQARSSFSVTMSDTVSFHTVAKALYIGVSGDLSVVNADGNTQVFKNVPVGIFTHQVQRVNATGTTASEIVALCDEPKPFFIDDVSGLTHRFDLSDFQSLTLGTDNEITAIANKVSGGDGLVKDPTHGGPQYQASTSVANNKPSAFWASEISKEGLLLPSNTTVNDIFAVMAYQSGTETTFDDFYTLFTSSENKAAATDSNRIIGGSGAGSLHGNIAFDQVSKNGAAAGNSILPLPLTVCRFSPANFSMYNVGGENSGASRAWRGHVCELLFFSSQVSADDAAKINNALYAKWGISA